MTALADHDVPFRQSGVEVLTMSVDSVFVHKMWDDHGMSKMVPSRMPFAMHSDGGEKEGTAYRVYREDAGVKNRGRFICNEKGVYRLHAVRMRLPGFLRALRAVT